MSLMILGINIAKLNFDACLIKENGKAKHKIFANTRHCFEQLTVLAWLAQSCRFARLSRGDQFLWRSTHCLYVDAGFPVSVVNPAAVKAFAARHLTRTKIDKVNAELIARFCLAQQPKIYMPPSP